MKYQSKRILCPMSDIMLTDEQIMVRYGQYFGMEPWVSFSGCPVVNLTRISGGTSPSTLLSVNQCIKIGDGCYIESTVLPAFPSGSLHKVLLMVNPQRFCI